MSQTLNSVSSERKKRILVVDDTVLFRELMQALLEKEGFEVLTANDGLEAIQKVKHELPHLDLVLLDLLLPQMTGFEVLKQIRAGKMGESLAVLVITGVFKKASQIEQIKTLGATGYMTKDLKPEEIIRRIKSTLGMEPVVGEEAKPILERAKKEAKRVLEKFDRIKLLSSSEVFSGLAPAQLEKVSKNFQEITLDKDKVIFKEGEEGDSLYIIGQGSVRVVKTGEGKEEEVIAILESGMSFGEMALVQKEQRSATIITNEPSILLKMGKDAFEKILESDKEIALIIYKNFVQLLANRLRKTSETLTFSKVLLEELRKK